jgi:pimeloyl-ACP methyl ester carboxylesterase
MRRNALFSSLLATALGASELACSESTPQPNPQSDAGDGGGGSDLTPSSACTDPVDSVYADPGPLSPDAAARGNVVKCAHDKDLSKDDVGKKLADVKYAGRAVTSGAKVYRVSYRTERGNAASTPSVSSAAVYIPDTPRAAKLPVVVASRGSRGQAPQCAASKLDPSLEPPDGVNGDLYALVYPLVGLGYAVIVPDLAGYANFGAPNNPPSAYAQATDVGRSTLDGARALKKLFPGLDDKVVLVGHSQGGHSTLAALAIAESYGFTSPIAGVAVFAPLWLSQRSWGAVLFRPVGKDYPIKDSPAGPVSVWYHYTQAELLDGPGEGKKLFAPGKQDAVKEFVDTSCWGKYPKLEAAATFADELFDPAFVKSVGFPATGLSDCEAGDAVCKKWMDRYSADRPHLTGKAAQTPILLMYGLGDGTIPKDRMKCAVDRLKADNAQVTYCVEPEESHGGIVRKRADYAADWIAQLTLGGAAPGACPQNEAALPAECATPPPND